MQLAGPSLELTDSQLLGVMLSLMSLPMSSPKDSMMAEILFHSSFSSKGDRMERLFSVELRFSLAAVSPVVVGDHVFSSLSTSIALRRKDNYVFEEELVRDCNGLDKICCGDL